jgi:L-rhamnose mutarotase
MTTPSVQRFGMVIGLKEDCEREYRDLHAGPGVRDLLTGANIRNFNIFLTEMPDGQIYEFVYYEYVGDDYVADMAKLADHPRNQAWLEQCDPMQIPLPGHNSWKMMESVFLQP